MRRVHSRVHHYTPESKEAGKWWRQRGNGHHWRQKERCRSEKFFWWLFMIVKALFLLIFSWTSDNQCRSNITYCQLLVEIKATYRTKRRRSSRQRWLHIVGITLTKLEKMHWQQVEHTFYSPDLSPCDYHLFGLLKKAPGGKDSIVMKELNSSLEQQVADNLLLHFRWRRYDLSLLHIV